MKDRQEKLFDAITMLDEGLINDADQFARQEVEEIKRRWKSRIRWRIFLILILLAGLACVLLFWDSGERKVSTGFERVDVFEGTASIPQSGLYPAQPGSIDLSEYDTRYLPSGKRPDGSLPKDEDPVKKLSVYQSLKAENTDDSYRLLIAWAEYLKTRAKEEFDLDLTYDLNDVKIGRESYDKENPTRLEPFPTYDMKLDLHCGETTIELVCLQDETVTYFDSMQGLEELYKKWSGQKSVQLPSNCTDEEILQETEPAILFVDRLLGTSFITKQPEIKRTREGALRVHYYMDQSNGSEISRELQQQENPKQDRMTFAFESSSDGHTFYLQGIGITFEYLNYIGEYELISLEEAEEELAQGYCFGRGLYPIYKTEEKALFSDYDFVRIQYPASHCEYVVPYYTFYKYVGKKQFDASDSRFLETGGLADEYAVVYVPAIRVEKTEEL